MDTRVNEEEHQMMNEIKGHGADLEAMIHSLRHNSNPFDQRWVSIAETHLQQGIMAAVRAVAKPESF